MRISLVLSLALLMALPVAAGELVGVMMDDSVSVGDDNLVLNGMGLRKKAMFKVYVGGLYLPARSSDSEAILVADGPRHMVMEFTHGNKSPRGKVDQLNAAHKAMILFDREKVDGRLRHKLVSDMVKSYRGSEACSQPPNPWSAQVFWERIGLDAIKVAQYFSFDPVGEDGQSLDTMEELAEWYRYHKYPSRPPWSDE